MSYCRGPMWEWMPQYDEERDPNDKSWIVGLIIAIIWTLFCVLLYIYGE